MTPELLRDFAVALERAKADRGARAGVLVGTGSCFSAGADLALFARDWDPERPAASSARRDVRACSSELRNVGRAGGSPPAGSRAVGGGLARPWPTSGSRTSVDKLRCQLRAAGLYRGWPSASMLPPPVGCRARPSCCTRAAGDRRGRPSASVWWSESLPGEQVFPRAMELGGEIALSPARRASDGRQTGKTPPGLGRGGRCAARGAAAERVAHHRGRRRGLAAGMREKRAPSSADD
ncbi:MAG: enoyl-CoA hydratase/isomerase family protein [Sandaracinaceae bacterium]|nr:enoyl-CoA hydratase/isomerase family protein [Sandaracinaceae bacterium]